MPVVSEVPEYKAFISHAKPGAVVYFWNGWQTKYGLFSGLGNSGVVIELVDDCTTILRCSDGPGEPDFESLVVEITQLQGLEHRPTLSYGS